MSIKSFPDYEHLLQENYVKYKHIFFLPLLRLVSKILCHAFIVTFGFWIQNFQTGGLGEMVRHPGHHDRRISSPTGFFLWGYVKDSVFDTISRYYKFEGKNNRSFCYNNWTRVGEHVERKWLSIRRSPRNKRSTCWSVLMCCKKTSYILKKNVCIARTVVFL